MGRVAQGRRAEARSGAPRRPHAGDLVRGAGHEGRAARHRHRDDVHVRPPRQAARVQRLAQRPRAMDAQARQRPAVRPRRRRRRLCGVCRDHRDQGARCAGHPAAALRRPDRKLRGKRLVRPAGLPRRAEAAPGRRRWWSASTPAPATTTSCGSPPRCAAWCRRAEGRDPDRRRALGRCQRPGAVELSHPAPVARSAGGFADRSAAARGVSLRRSRPSAWSRRGRPRRCWATRCGSASRGPAVPMAAPSLPTTTDPVEALLNRTWRPTLSVTGVDGMPELRRRQRAATLHRVQAEPAPAAAGRRPRGGAEAEGAAGGQRAVQRARHVPARRPRRARSGATGWKRRRAVAGARAATTRRRRTTARRSATSARAARSR